MFDERLNANMDVVLANCPMAAIMPVENELPKKSKI